MYPYIIWLSPYGYYNLVIIHFNMIVPYTPSIRICSSDAAIGAMGRLGWSQADAELHLRWWHEKSDDGKQLQELHGTDIRLRNTMVSLKTLRDMGRLAFSDHVGYDICLVRMPQDIPPEIYFNTHIISSQETLHCRSILDVRPTIISQSIPPSNFVFFGMSPIENLMMCGKKTGHVWSTMRMHKST